MLIYSKAIREEDLLMTTRLMRLRYASLMILIFILWSVSTAAAQVPTFSGPTTLNGDNTPYAIAAGDFNGDGKIDLAFPNVNSDDVSILLGNGNGTFGAATNFPLTAGAGPQYAAVGDFNRDGKLDLAIADNASGNMSILLGNGDGTFQAAVDYAAGLNPRDIVARDLNGDGKLDLIVTNSGTNTISVYIGNGDGTFKPQVTYTVGNSARAVVVGDFNKDGKLDLAVTNTNDNTVSILLGNGDGTFKPQVTYATGNAPWFLCTGDFLGNGNHDLAIANNTDNNVSILLGNGDGTFQAQQTYPPAANLTGAHSIETYDFNGDGILDLVVANNGSNNISILLGNGNGSFQNPINFTVGNGPKGMFLGDLNADGRADIAVANVTAGNVSVLLNTTAAFPTMTLTGPASTTAGTPFSVTVTMKSNGITYTAYRGTVHFTSSDVQAGLPANYTFTAADNGVHTFTNLVTLKTVGNQTVRTTDTLNAYDTGTITVAVNPGPASVFTVTTSSGSSTAGTVLTVTVTAKDAYGNVATGYTGTVHFTSTDLQAVLPANYTFVAGDNGVHTFNVTLKTAGSDTVTATDTVTSSITGTSSAVNVSPAAASQLTVAAPAAATAGTAFNVTVTAKDAYGNTATGYTGIVHFTSSDVQAVLPANYTFVAGDNGIHTFTNLTTLKTAGNQTITGTDTVTASITGTSGTIVVSPNSGGPLHYAVAAPASATAGTAFSITVTAKDQFNNTVPTYTGTVHFTSTDGAAVLPANYTFVAGDNGVHTFTNLTTLKTSGNQTVTGTDTVTASITGTSGTIAVSAAAATHYTMVAPASATAGTAFSVTVTALDQFNNVATGYTGIVHFTSSDGQAVLPANYTFVAGDNGVHTFTNLATLKTSGNQTITGTDTVTASITGTSGTIAVSTAAASVFTVTTSSGSSTAGTVMTVTVTARDAYGNVVTGYTGTVHFTSNDGQAVLPANYTFVAGDNGVHTFNVTLKTAGSDTVTATDTVTSSITGTSSAVNVSPAAASQLTVTAPGAATAGTAFNVTVTAKDPYNNTVTNYTGTITFTSSDPQAVLPGSYTFVAGDNGVHTFSNGVTLKTAGSQTVTETDGGGHTGSATVNVTFASGGATKLLVTAPASSAAGAAFNVTVTALDQFNNTVTNYTGTVQFTSSDGQALLPGNYTFVAGDNGVHTFNNGVTLKTAGSQTVTATDGGGHTGSATVNVTFASGGATKLLLTAPASSAAGAE